MAPLPVFLSCSPSSPQPLWSPSSSHLCLSRFPALSFPFCRVPLPSSLASLPHPPCLRAHICLSRSPRWFVLFHQQRRTGPLPRSRRGRGLPSARHCTCRPRGLSSDGSLEPSKETLSSRGLASQGSQAWPGLTAAAAQGRRVPAAEDSGGGGAWAEPDSSPD